MDRCIVRWFAEVDVNYDIKILSKREYIRRDVGLTYAPTILIFFLLIIVAHERNIQNRELNVVGSSEPNGFVIELQSIVWKALTLIDNR